MKERRSNYLVGFIGQGQVAYGKNVKHERVNRVGNAQWAEPMTLLQAKKYAKYMKSTNSPRVKIAIYKLEAIEIH